jgi:broad specificity phosphatase PhoE
MLQPNDLPLLCLPTDLSDEAAAKLVEFLHELTEALERYYCAQLRRLYSTTDIAARNLELDLGPDSTDPPF